MNTPMQELIEQLKELKAYTAVTHGLERSLPYQTAIDYAETMLEQEKEAIKDAYDAGLFDGSMEDVDNRLYKDYYNKTFNTSVEMNSQEQIQNQTEEKVFKTNVVLRIAIPPSDNHYSEADVSEYIKHILGGSRNITDNPLIVGDTIDFIRSVVVMSVETNSTY